MGNYQHTQRVGILYYLIFIVVASLFSTFYFARVLPMVVPILMISLVAAFMLTFHSLSVSVDPAPGHDSNSAGVIGLKFGLGWPAKSIALDEVVSVELVENRWFYGFGVRMTPHGWMWNVSGFKAVELTFTDGKRFRIGSDEPDELRDAIRSALPS